MPARRSFHRLRVLQMILSCNDCPDGMVTLIAAAQHVRNLHTLRVGDNCSDGSVLGLALLRQLGQTCHNLREIDLDALCDPKESVPDMKEAFQALLAGNPGLRVARLYMLQSYASVVDTVLFALAQHCPCVCAVAVVCGKQGCSDAAIVALAQGCPLLRELDHVLGRETSDTAVLALAQHCPLLMSLDLSACVKATETAVAQLLARCRGLQRLYALRR